MTEGQPETPEQVLEAMDHFGIHEALCVDPLGRETNPMGGNERIIERTADHPRLHPAWTGLMPQSREFPPPDEFVTQMHEQGVGALYLFYRQFDIRLEDWGIDPLLEALAEKRVPVFLSPDNRREPGKIDVTDWTNVVRICREFPELPVVVTERRIYKSQRAVWAALEECPNLKVDLASLWLHGAAEFCCREFGADHLIWGSHLPDRTPASILMQLNYSDISDDELAAIAGGNLRAMLSWNDNIEFADADEIEFSEPLDELHEKARSRASFEDEEFFDCHGHIGWCTPHHVIHDTPADMVEEMDKFGVQKCLVFSIGAAFGDETWCNDRVAEVIKEFPDRLIGFTFINLNHGPRLIKQELERGMEMGMQGIKLIAHYQGYPTEGPNVDIPCEFAHEHGLFILNHDWGSPEQMRRLCKTYPDALFITGHSKSTYGDIVQEVDNLYICTCPFLAWGQTERFVEIYPPERIMFGSDLTDLPIGWGLAQIMYADIPEVDKRKILGENLRRLLPEYTEGH
ncbi:MAG: amidohydrolase family protein [Armatimonadota bacterium]